MPKPSTSLFDIQCPCCQSTLRVDPETRAVITHKEKVKPPPIEDLTAAVARLKSEPKRREEMFRKSLEEQKSHHKVLEKKFDELFKRAKEEPDLKPPIKDIDLD